MERLQCQLAGLRAEPGNFGCPASHRTLSLLPSFQRSSYPPGIRVSHGVSLSEHCRAERGAHGRGWGRHEVAKG